MFSVAEDKSTVYPRAFTLVTRNPRKACKACQTLCRSGGLSVYLAAGMIELRMYHGPHVLTEDALRNHSNLDRLILTLYRVSWLNIQQPGISR